MRLLIFLLLLGGCLGTVLEPSPPIADRNAVPAEAPPPDLDALPELVHRTANDARQSSGRPALAWSDALAAVAEAHSRDMAARGYFAHDSPEGATPSDRALAAGIECRVDVGGGRSRVGVAENLFQITRYEHVRTRTVGDQTTRMVDWFTPAEIAREVIDGWLDSSGHRRNLLDDVSTQHGIGIAVDVDDRITVTQVLC